MSKHFWNWSQNGDENILHLNGTIAEESWFEDDITPALFRAELEKCISPITVYINSPGGEINAGLLIYDALQGCRTEINLYCIGLCASMAAIILAGGQKGRRFATPHSKLLLHEPLLSGGFAGSASSIQRTAESIMETKRIIAELLAKDTGKDIESIDKAIAFDNYLNAQEAVAFGLCDRIVTSIV